MCMSSREHCRWTMTQEAKHHKFAVKNKQQMAVSECLQRIPTRRDSWQVYKYSCYCYSGEVSRNFFFGSSLFANIDANIDPSDVGNPLISVISFLAISC